MTDLQKSILLRFARAFIAGAVGNMIIVLSFSGNSWNDIRIWLAALAMSGFVGGISGGIMALDKLIRS